jgi:hypothetical protein
MGSLASSRKAQWLLFGSLGLGVLIVVGALSFVLWVQSYLRSEPFRKSIARKTSDFLKVEGAYLPFHWSGFSVWSEGFTAQGGPGASFTDFRADQIGAEFNPRSLFQKAWQIDQLQIQRLQVTLGARAPLPAHAEERAGGPSTPPPHSESSNPVDLRRVVIQEMNVKWPGAAAGEISNVQLTLTPEGQEWNVTGTGGRLIQKDWPVLNINQFKSRYRSPQLVVTDARFRMNDQGNLDASGEVLFEQNPRFRFDLKFSGIPVAPFLPEDWRARLTGNLGGEAKVNGPFSPSEAMEASGTVALTNGRLEALPFLEQIALFTRTKEFRQLALQRASAEFTWAQSKLTVNRLLAESERLLRIEGDFVVNQRTIDGTFRVGLTPSSLQWLPGAQSKVFTVQTNGYLWATMRLTGPVEHLTEDLTPRLVVAAKDTVIEDVKGAVEKGTKDVIEFLKPLLK